MRRIKSITAFLLAIGLFLACSGKKEEQWLMLAGTYADVNPDSCLFFLNKIKSPDKLPDKEWARYQLFRVKADMWKGQKQHSDSLLLLAAGTLVQEKDSNYAADAYFRAGLIHFYDGKYLKTDSLFSIALRYALDPKTRAYLYEIGGYNYLRLDKAEQAITYYRKALEDKLLIPPDWEAYLLADIGWAFRTIEQPDSALYYYSKAADVARSLNRLYLLTENYNRISDIHKESGNFQLAVEALRKSIDLENSREGVPFYMLSYAKIFMAEGKTDSAYVYLQKAIQSPDMYIATKAYQYMAELYEPLNKDSVSFSRWDTYKQSFRHVTDNLESEIMRKKFQDEKLRNENNELKLKQKQKDIYLLSLCLVLISICAIAYLFYSRERKKKVVAQLERERERIALQEKATALREQLFRKLSVSQKIPSLSGKQEESVHDSNSRLTEEDFEELMQTVDSIWPGFGERLQSTYPLLKPKDITFCCLLKSGISVKDMASIYYVTPSAISQKKARLKREKFAIHDDTVSFDDVLRDF